MQVQNPQIVTGKLVKGRKHPLVRITCPHCHLEHNLPQVSGHPHVVQIGPRTMSKPPTRRR